MSLNSRAETKLTLHYSNEITVKAVAEAISPDNFQAPEGIEMSVEQRKSEVIVCIHCFKGVGSLLSTIDDLLSCVNAAEKSLNCLE